MPLAVRYRLWDTASGKKTREWQMPGAHGLAFAPDGRHLAVASASSTVYILRLAEK